LRSKWLGTHSLIFWFIAKMRTVIRSSSPETFPKKFPKNIFHFNAFETFRFFKPHPTGGPGQSQVGPGTSP
jgi:glycine cleavage system protein P-like pyridoxal-binding family